MTLSRARPVERIGHPFSGAWVHVFDVLLHGYGREWDAVQRAGEHDRWERRRDAARCMET